MENKFIALSDQQQHPVIIIIIVNTLRQIESVNYTPIFKIEYGNQLFHRSEARIFPSNHFSLFFLLVVTPNGCYGLATEDWRLFGKCLELLIVAISQYKRMVLQERVHHESISQIRNLNIC